MDYFDNESRQKKRLWREYSQEELDGLRRAAEVSRARWRAEIAARGQPVYEAKRFRLRPGKKPGNGAQERSKFASSIARAEFRRSYWSAEQDARLREAMARPKPLPAKKSKPKR